MVKSFNERNVFEWNGRHACFYLLRVLSAYGHCKIWTGVFLINSTQTLTQSYTFAICYSNHFLYGDIALNGLSSLLLCNESGWLKMASPHVSTVEGINWIHLCVCLSICQRSRAPGCRVLDDSIGWTWEGCQRSGVFIMHFKDHRFVRV